LSFSFPAILYYKNRNAKSELEQIPEPDKTLSSTHFKRDGPILLNRGDPRHIQRVPSKRNERVNLGEHVSRPASFELVRVKEGDSQRSLICNAPIKVFKGAIWGRTVVSSMTGRRPRARSTNTNHIDLGIGYGKREDGVSRKHVEVISISSQGVLAIVCSSVKSPLLIISGEKNHHFQSGSVVLVKDGDIIVFDTYMKRPHHMFIMKKSDGVEEETSFINGNHVLEHIAT